MAIKCPYCGRRIATNQSRPTVFESSARTPLKNAAAVLPPPPPITHPTGLPSMESHVHVPANQAIVGGCLVAPAIGLIVFSGAYIGNISTGTSILAGALAGGITLFSTAAWQWFSKTAFYDSLLIQEVESYLGFDLDGDGQVGRDAIKVEVSSEDGNRWQFADLPGKPAALRDFAGRVLMGQGFTDETGAMSGLTQKEVKDLREAFVSRGWAGWKHPQRKQMGIEVLHVGKSVLRAIAGDSPTLSAST